MSKNQQSMATPLKRTSGISTSVYILTIGFTLAVGFVGGTRSHELFGAIAPALGIKVETGTLDLRSVQSTYQQLRANYDGTLSDQALIDGASRGLVAAAGDKYTIFMDAKEASEFEQDYSGAIGGGIGAEIGVRHDQPTIIRTLEGNPAANAGIQAGDVIISINGESAVGWDSTKAADKIRGEPDTTVKLSLRRGLDIKDFSVTRAIIDNPSVRSEVSNGIGILTISRFDDKTGSLARRAATALKDQGIKKVILDLRGNGGGSVSASQEVAGLWVGDKVVMREYENGRVTEELKGIGSPVLKGLQTVVLVDGGSASASEIVAGALQDYAVATLIGEKTFGKGTVQRVIDLGGGTTLKVTVARWYTPDGKNITKNGIQPNKTVPLSSEQINDGKDPQLSAAKASFR